MLTNDRVKHVCLGRRPMRNYNTMLHMKLNTAVSVFSIAAAFSVFFPPSNAYGGICFLPDCNLDLPSYDDVNSDSSWCIDNGYYFTCPEGTAPDYSQTCPRDESYTKCSSEQWCIDNGYTKTAQSCYDLGPTWFPQNLCPKGFDLYKSCVEDTAQACEDKGYVNNCSRPDKTEICEWDSSFAKCCNDTESNGCPENSKVSGCEDGTIVGQDTCGYDCHQCCQTSCPAGYAYTDEETSGGTSGYIKDGDDYCLHCTRGKLYKRKENPCTGYDLCSGYGGVDNGDYCYTGNTKKYSKCREECLPGYIEWCDTPVTDCEKLGYKKTVSQCNGKFSFTCPFNKDKVFCADDCTYTFTASDCASQNKNIGSQSCTRNGTTYYASCGTTCANGNCTSTPSQSECNYVYLASDCANQCKEVGSKSCTRDGKTYYENCGNTKCSENKLCNDKGSCITPWYGYCCDDVGSCDTTFCKAYNYPDCSDIINSCKSLGRTPKFDHCTQSASAHVAIYTCEKEYQCYI